MDDQRFDDLIKTLAAKRISRAGALRGLVGGTLAAVAATALGGEGTDVLPAGPLRPERDDLERLRLVREHHLEEHHVGPVVGQRLRRVRPAAGEQQRDGEQGFPRKGPGPRPRGTRARVGGHAFCHNAGTLGGSQPGSDVCACRHVYVAPP